MDNMITAKEARKQAQDFRDSYEQTLDKLMSQIRREARQGHMNLFLTDRDFTRQAWVHLTTEIPKYLEKLGYEVTFTRSETYLAIYWHREKEEEK